MLLDPLTLERSRGAIEALAPERRRALVRHWQRRAKSEARIGLAFAELAKRLHAHAVAPALIEHFVRASAEEREHAELCHALADAYADAPLERPAAPLEVALPQLEPEPRLDLALLVLGTCCINETLASAYIRTCLQASHVACALAANRTHLREEIGHARMGWALLASPWCDAGLREQLAVRVPAMLDANVPMWMRVDDELGAAEIPGFGHPSHAQVRASLDAAVREVVLPGLAHVGLRVAA